MGRPRGLFPLRNIVVPVRDLLRAVRLGRSRSHRGHDSRTLADGGHGNWIPRPVPALPFSLGCLVAIPLSLIAILSGSVYAKNLLLAMDKLGAASLKFSGVNTVSAECGRLLHQMKDGLTASCILCKLLCRFIHEMDAGHCDRNARDDGLITYLQTSSTLGVTAGERAPTV